MLRYENFGAIVSVDEPPTLAFVDRAYTRGMGYKDSSLWGAEAWNGVLSAPVEAHYAVTNYCPLECPGCYMASENNPAFKMDERADLDRAKKIADRLVEMNIFHVALGGGESFSLPWFHELAEYLRARGVVPNVTTSGYYLNEDLIGKCGPFGQINVSLDGIGDDDNPLRPPGHFKKADAALRLLKRHGIRVGINCIISRHNFDSLDKIAAYARARGVVDVEFLRFKPAGRGKEIYHEMALTPEQGKALFPRLKKIAWRRRVNIKLDCSFTPFVCYHNPSKKVLDFFSILGCDAGNWLIGVSPGGEVSPCSFIEGVHVDVDDLKEAWGREETFSTFRFWDRDPKGICRSCSYVSICKGGCHAVSKFLTGSFDAPDPECPRSDLIKRV